MSEMPAGAMSLEDDPTPAPEPEPQAPAPVDPPAPVAAADADPEGTVVNPGGEKLVPLSAVSALRQEKQALKQQIEQLRPKAEKVDQVVAEWQAAQPLIQRALYQPQAPPPPAPAGPLSDQEAVEYAKELDLYTPEGKPDTGRAQRIAARNESLAERKAQAMVAPLHAQTADAQSNANLAAAIAHADKQKMGVDPGILRQVWSIVPKEMSARPDVAGVLWRVALAESVMAGNFRAPVNAPPPPVMTESVGGDRSKPAALTATAQAFRQAADITPKEYEKIASRYEPGKANSLE